MPSQSLWLHVPQDKTSTGSNLKIQALQFLNSAMAANDPAVFQASGSLAVLGLRDVPAAAHPSRQGAAY